MTLADLLEGIFGDATVVVFDENTDEEITITDYNAADAAIAQLDKPCLSLVADGQLYALCGEDVTKPTLFASDEFVYVLTDPVEDAKVSFDEERFRDWISLTGEITEGSGNTHSWEEMFDVGPTTHVDTSPSVAVEDGASDEGSGSVAGADEGASEQVNAAIVRGAEHPDMVTLLNQPVTFMTGKLYGQGDRRNTQAGGWKKHDSTWGGLLTHPKSPLTNHPVAKSKEGDSIVIGETVDGQRTANSVKSLGAVVIDIDSGPTIDSVIARLEELGVFAIVYSSFNHLKESITLKHDDVVQKMKLDATPTRPEIIEYMRTHHKDRYADDLMEDFEVVDSRHHGPNGLQIILKTPPLHKMRIVLPLMQPAVMADLATTAAKWKDAWADIVTGFVVNQLEVTFDSSSCDVNRLFYLPRHSPDSGYVSTLIMGRPIRYDEIEPYSKDTYVKHRGGEVDPFDHGEDTLGGGGSAPLCVTPNGLDLNTWHTKFKNRFMLPDLLLMEAADKVRREVTDGKVEIECPFEHEHSTEGSTGTIVFSPLVHEHEVWSVSCPHDACQGRHKLEFLEGMVKDGWFDESELTNPDYMLPGEEPEPDKEAEEVAEMPQTQRSQLFVDRFEKLARPLHDDAIIGYMDRAHQLGISQSEQNQVSNLIKAEISLTLADLKKMWKDRKRYLEKQATTEESEEDIREFTAVPKVNAWDFLDMCEYGQRRIQDENAKDARLFSYMEDIARIEETNTGLAKLKILDRFAFAAELNGMSRWETVNAEGDKRGVSAPRDVVDHLFYSKRTIYPPIRDVINTPVYTQDGDLLYKPGFDVKSGLYHHQDMGLDIPKVSKEPSEDEVRAAKETLFDLFADFPLGGYKRDEIMARGMTEEGIPALTHTLSLILLPLVREMIDGPTPGHLFTKPTPGTGASLLMDTCSAVAFGAVTAPAAMPRSDDDMAKLISSYLQSNAPAIYFDNISASVDSGVLASAMTGRRYQARLLGKTQLVDAEVRCVWVFTGNNVALSGELLRRLIMVDLDTGMADPTARKHFKYDSIVEHVLENRGDILHACYTLVNNWVAKGRPEFREKALSSFEPWSRVMGGIMEAAGIGGFLGNLDTLKNIAGDGAEEEIMPLLESWWESYGTEQVIVKESDKHNSLMNIVLSNDIQLNLKTKLNLGDGDRSYEGRAFGNFLSQQRGRVFILSTGEHVRITSVKTTTRQREGTRWILETVEPEKPDEV